MPSFRYRTTGRWFKGNTHIHSKASDGGEPFADIAVRYARVSYDFLCRTDHWVSSNVAADPATYPLLWLDGIELDGNDTSGAYYHVVALGTFAGLTRELGFVPALDAARAQGGLLILAHPQWTGNTLDDALRWRFGGVEVYNHVCRWLNGKSDGHTHWHAMLDREPQTLAFAADDAHLSAEHPGWNGGWVMVNAPRLDRAALMDAIRTGNFYATCGPEFNAIEQVGDRVRVRTSPVRYIRVVGPRWNGLRAGTPDGDLLTSAELPLPADWPYAYLELEDATGRRAWSNPLFIP